ncbi:hypothetical protein PENSPDRAFT_348870 [Peniophora sp. CONT]|nr:hypothetical protein PENSPDRAFT_348870 [Peniophora sp. CONT]
MVGLGMLRQIDSRLKQAKPNGEVAFGGYHLALIGDFAQLPPVMDTALYAPPGVQSSQLTRDGHVLYRHFSESYMLKTIVRQQGDSDEQRKFKLLLKHASEKGLTKDDWEVLVTRESTNLTPAERAAFRGTLSLYTTREAVETINLESLDALGRPVARVKAQGSPGSAGLTAEDANGLDSEVLLACGARVMVTRNLWQQKGLVNGALGTVEDVVWLEGAQRSDLPLAVLVSIPEYTGPTLWRTAPRDGYPTGIPIVPITAVRVDFRHASQSCWRTQLPLSLSWAVTVHKSQGLTLGRIRVGLGRREFANGLTFVALSRVRNLQSICLADPVDFSRVEKLGGRSYELRLLDHVRRYPVAAFT